MLATKPLDIRPDHAEIIHEILKDNLEEGTYVFAFGSRANWTAKQSSDLDLAIDGFGVKLDKKIKSNLEDAFEESDLPYKVDVVDLNSVSESFREAIQDQLVRVLWDWRKVIISEISNFNPENITSSDLFDNYLYLDTGNITDNSINNIQLFSNPRNLPSRAKRKVKDLDLIYSCVRPVQRHFGILKNPLPNLIVSTGFAVIRCNQTHVNPHFLYYYLSNDQIINYLQGIAEHSTSAYPSIRPDDIGSLSITLPPLLEQKRIAEILSSLDNKIEINKQINQTLEAMAEALFKSWFIDFDPVRVKKAALEAGAGEEEANLAVMKFISSKTDEELEKFQNDYLEKYRELEDIAKLFPAGFQDGELGEIPLGWRVGKLGEEFDIIMGQSPDGKSYNEAADGMVFFQGRAEFQERFPKVRLYTTEPKRIAEKFDVLVSVRAPVGDVNVALEKCCIGRGLAAVKSHNKSYAVYKIKSLRESFDKFEAEGTVFGSINKESFINIQVVIPLPREIKKFEDMISLLDEKIYINSQQIQSLTRNRDELLPRLMRGELCR